MFLAILAIAIFAPLVAPHDPMKQNLGDNFLPPVWKNGGSWSYPFGTDPLGRDIMSRLIYGARSSLLISVGAVVIGMAIGFFTGLIAGFYGGVTDATLMRLGDVQLAFPFVLFAIAIFAVSPNRTVWHLMAVLGISSWVIYARIVRSRVLSERNKATPGRSGGRRVEMARYAPLCPAQCLAGDRANSLAQSRLFRGDRITLELYLTRAEAANTFMGFDPSRWPAIHDAGPLDGASARIRHHHYRIGRRAGSRWIRRCARSQADPGRVPANPARSS